MEKEQHITVPFLDLQAAYDELGNELDNALQAVGRSGQYLLGENTELFEKEFALYCDAKYCIGVGNGLDALTLILRSLKIGLGDEVIVPAHTFIATWLAVSAVGAKPIPVEVCEYHYTISPQLIQQAITPNTKAIIAVHLYGYVADMEELNDIAAKNNIVVIEDAAQAHGAVYQGKKAGGLGVAAAFSFYPGKNLGAFGDGGAVTTNREDIYEGIKTLRNYGSSKKYIHEIQGINSRLDEIQASALQIKLKKLDEWNKRRMVLAQYYIDKLSNLPLNLPQPSDVNRNVRHIFPIRCKERDLLQRYLQSVGVQTVIHYPVPIFLQQAYRSEFSSIHFPFSENIAKELLSLPIGPHCTELQAEYVCKHIHRFYMRNK